MARGINKVILIGNLGADPEVRFTPANAAVCNISVATTDQWKDKQSGEQQEKTEWHRCVAFNRLAEIMGEYLRKGSKVYIEGRLQTRKWQGQDGQDKYTTEIVVVDMQMLDGKPADGGQRPASPPAQQQPLDQYGTQAPPAQSQGDPGIQDDDIPF